MKKIIFNKDTEAWEKRIGSYKNNWDFIANSAAYLKMWRNNFKIKGHEPVNFKTTHLKEIEAEMREWLKNQTLDIHNVSTVRSPQKIC